MEEAEYLCDRVAIMAEGKILTMNEPQSLIEDLSHTTQISFFVEEELPPEWAKDIPEIEKVYSNYPKVILEIKSLDSISNILDTLKQQQIRFSGFTVKTATLEDVYLDLTGQEFGEDTP
jgi:ABC-2 type transport system ATP-binding protein